MGVEAENEPKDRNQQKGGTEAAIERGHRTGGAPKAKSCMLSV